MAAVDLAIRGMTCRACEVRVGKALRAVDGVQQVRVSATKGTARVVTTGPVPRRSLVAAVDRAGYQVGEDDRAWVSGDPRVLKDVALAVMVVVLVAVVANAAGLDDVLGRLGAGLGTGAGGTGGLAVAALLGLTAGLSTCMALVGGLVLAVSARYAETHPQASARRRLRPHLAFNAGRVVGYGLGGAFLGLVGSAVQVSGGPLALMTLVISAAMVAVGLRLTGVSPRLARFSLALPAGVADRLRLDRAADGSTRYGDLRSAGLGAATFLLPCGFTQVVQLAALATGSPVQAALLMAVFAVGTVPGLLSIGGLTAVVRGAVATRFFRFAGVAVLAFAAVNTAGALNVLAPGLLAPQYATATTVSQNVTLEDGVQVLRTVQEAGGYSPAQATVVAGTPVRWEIDSVAASCASLLSAPAMGLGSVVLDAGINVLEFTPTEPGRLHYSCAMGMYSGVIDVIEPPAA